MKQKWMKLLSVFLVLCMTVSMLPTAMAAELLEEPPIQEDTQTGQTGQMFPDGQDGIVGQSSDQLQEVPPETLPLPDTGARKEEWTSAVLPISAYTAGENSRVYYLTRAEDAWSLDGEEPYPFSLYRNSEEGGLYYQVDGKSYEVFPYIPNEEGTCTIEGKTFYVTEEEGAYLFWREEIPEPDPTPEEPNEEETFEEEQTTPPVTNEALTTPEEVTYYTPKDAIEKGNSVYYVSFGTVEGANNGGWQIDTQPYDIYLYQLSDSTTTNYVNAAVTAATSIESGTSYAICGNNNRSLMHFTANTAYTNQCGFNKSTLGGCGANHLFTLAAGKTEGCYTIHSLADTADAYYLGRESQIYTSGSKKMSEIALTAAQEEFYITPSDTTGAYNIWWEEEPEEPDPTPVDPWDPADTYKAQLGTDSNFSSDVVPLTNALYTFTTNSTGYTIASTVPGTQTDTYLNIGANIDNTRPPSYPNKTVPTSVAVTTSSSGTGWFYLKDTSSLHFPGVNGAIHWNRCGNPCGAAHNIALFRPIAENETSSEEIPGYVRLTSVNDIQSGKKYLIAATTNGNWYVLYPTTSTTDVYAHIAKVVPPDAQPFTPLGGAISEMFTTTDPDNTWVFTGGADVEGGFEQTQGMRNYMGQFEEYIRWTQSANTSNGADPTRQRYTINTAYDGLTLQSVVDGWQSLVAGYNPRAVVYMVQEGDTAEQLKSFIDKALALRGGNGFAVIQTLNGTGSTVVNEAVAAYSNDPSYSRIVVVNHTLTDAQMTGGHPNGEGHYELGKQLAEATYGSSVNYPCAQGVAEFAEAAQPTTYDTRTAPTVEFSGDVMTITLSGVSSFTYELRLENGVTVSGSAANSATISGLDASVGYTLITRSQDGSTQYKTIRSESALTAQQQEIVNLVENSEEPLTWLFMGDSITHGALWTKGYDSISQTFDKYLDLLGRDEDVVINTAVSGATAGSTLRNIEQRMEQYEPDVVSIMLGTNDQANGYGDAASYQTNLESIISKIRAKNPDAVIILRSPTGNWAGRNVAPYCETMRAVAERNNLIYIDQYTETQGALDTYSSWIKGNQLFYGNNLHPGALGQLAMSKMFIKAIGLWDEDNPIANLDYVAVTDNAGTGSLDDALSYSGNTLTLNVSKLGGSLGETTLSAAKDGQTWSATAKAGENPQLTLPDGTYTVTAASVSTSAAQRLRFSAQDTVTLPGEKSAAQMPPPPAIGEMATKYLLIENEIVEGTYAISYQGSKDNSLLFHKTGKTDQVGGTVNGNELSMPSNANWTDANMLWIISPMEEGYSIQNKASKQYLNITGATTPQKDGGISLSSTPQVLAIQKSELDGAYIISAVVNNTTYYIHHNDSTGNDRWYHITTEPTSLRLYAETEVLLEYEMAPTEFKGTSTGNPLVRDDTSSYFRIPSLITLDNGWIMASSDIRWCGTGDNPSNIDTIISISKDGGKTWNWEVVNYFADHATTFSNSSSTAFIDPSFVQSEKDNKVWMIVDATPAYGGNMSGNRMLPTNSPYLSGFDSQGRVLVGYIPDVSTSTYTPQNGAYRYDYYVDLNNPNAGEGKVVKGETITLYPICAQADSAPTGYYADAFANTYYDYGGEKGIEPVLTQQMGSSKLIHNNLFYLQSEWKVPCTFYLMVRSAEITDSGLVWSDPTFINVKKPGERFTGVCPGRGTITTVNGNERIIFPLYDNGTGNELASVTYSDDGGATWQRGERTTQLNGTGKSSESQIVVLPSGNLRMYSRNTIHYISYTDSTDSGVTWGPYQQDLALYSQNPGNGCMVSFINVAGYLIAPDNTVYENLIMASYPKIQRKVGIIRIGSIDVETNQVTWLDNGEYTIGTDAFAYSCLTQLRDEKGNYLNQVSVLPELNLSDNTGIPYMPIDFETFLPGYKFVVMKPDELPALSLDKALLDLNLGTYADVTATTENDQGNPVVWSSSDPSVATVENGRVTAVASGKAVITATLTAADFVRTATVEVLVQDGETVLLPDEHEGEVAEDVEKTYPKLTSDLVDGVYVIYDPACSGRPRNMHSSDSVTNQCDSPSPSNGRITLGTCGEAHLWRFTQQEDRTWVIVSVANGKYLTDTASSNQLALSDTPTYFTITGNNGSYQVSTDKGNLWFNGNGWKMNSTAKGLELYQENVSYTYTASNEELSKLIVKAEAAGIEIPEACTAAMALQTVYTGTDEAVVKAQAENVQTQINEASKALYALLRGDGDGQKPEDPTPPEPTIYTITFIYSGTTMTVTCREGELPQAPAVPAYTSGNYRYTFSNWDPALTAAAADAVYHAQYTSTYTGITVTPGTPDFSGGNSATGTRPGNSGTNIPENPTPLDPGTDIGDEDIPLASIPLPFLDVKAADWHRNAVAYVYSKGMMGGTSVSAFEPESRINRGMIVTILHRLEGTPAAGVSGFLDVLSGMYYTEAVAWAAREGVVTGFSDTEFRPEQDITREQLAAILYRYAQLKGFDTTARADLSGYVDHQFISNYAVDAMQWAVASGLISGVTENTLEPTGSATRAQAAMILMRFCENVAK